MEHHTANVARKISTSIGIIYKSSFSISDTSLRTLYYTLAYIYSVYCVSLWASTHPTNVKRILILQKKSSRINSKKPFDAQHTDPILEYLHLRLLKFHDIYMF